MSIKLKKIDEYRWEVPKSGSMRVPGIIYSTSSMLEEAKQQEPLKQVANVATLPGILKASLAMPDMHWGYGFPIGGVAAFDWDSGIISPGGVGYDINCGVRLATTSIVEKEIRPKLANLVDALFRNIPSGVGSTGQIKLSISEEKKVLKEGSRWAVRHGYGEDIDLEHTEDGGCMPNADPDVLSKRALERGLKQLGTLGSGNHFIEIGVVETVYDDKAAQVFGVQGKRYYNAMACGANYAWANRQILMHMSKDVLLRVLGIGPRDLGLNLVYDVCHNIAKKETHVIDGKKLAVCVHRKGATRAFPPHHEAICDKYQSTGQPVIIPGDMGTASYILAGTQRAMEETFGSTCHGAGRILSRKAAKKASKGRSIQRELENKGIFVRWTGRSTLAEEMPDAYKDVSQVVKVVHDSGISKKVAKLRPIAVVKG